MKRITALFLVVASMLLAACGDGDGVIDNPDARPVVDNADVVVMSYDGNTLSSGMYAFIFSALKTNYLYLLQLYGETEFVEDTESFWSLKTADGKTFAQSVTDDINNHCRMLLICQSMAKDYGVSLDEQALESVTDEYNDYVASYGGETELGAYLVKFGINCEDLTRYLEMKETISVLQDKLCAEGGLCEVNDDDVYSLIDEEYVKAKHIYLLNSKYDGKALDKANELLALIQSGENKYEDFSALSDDNSSRDYPDGFLVNLEETEERYAKLVASLDEGEYGVCEADDGAYLVSRVGMTDDDRKTRYDSAWQEIADKLFSEVMSDRYGQVELNREELDKYDVITADVLR